MIEHDTGLNKQAKNAFQQTLIEADRFVPKTISTGHFLLGLIASSTEGACERALRLNRVSIEPARFAFGEIVGHHNPLEGVSIGEIVFTPRLQRALEIASLQSARYQQLEIGTEHLLLGLLADDDEYELPEEECRAPRLLKLMQVDPVKVKAVLEASIEPFEGMDDTPSYQPIRAIYVQDCRNCGEEVSLKASVCKVCQSGVSELQFKVCPSCAEWIRKNAVRCRFCRQELQPS